MHDYCPDAPSVDLFTADEKLVLATWFKIDRPSYGPRVDDIFDRWNISSDIPDYRRIDAAVARALSEQAAREVLAPVYGWFSEGLIRAT